MTLQALVGVRCHAPKPAARVAVGSCAQSFMKILCRIIRANSPRAAADGFTGQIPCKNQIANMFLQTCIPQQ